MTEREQEPSEAGSAEVPVEDALEQRIEVLEPEGTGPTGDPADDLADLGEADPADRAEQGRVVDPGDDEYR